MYCSTEPNPLTIRYSYSWSAPKVILLPAFLVAQNTTSILQSEIRFFWFKLRGDGKYRTFAPFPRQLLKIGKALISFLSLLQMLSCESSHFLRMLAYLPFVTHWHALLTPPPNPQGINQWPLVSYAKHEKYQTMLFSLSLKICSCSSD